jgi:hypothetical protein
MHCPCSKLSDGGQEIATGKRLGDEALPRLHRVIDEALGIAGHEDGRKPGKPSSHRMGDGLAVRARAEIEVGDEDVGLQAAIQQGERFGGIRRCGTSEPGLFQQIADEHPDEGFILDNKHRHGFPPAKATASPSGSVSMARDCVKAPKLLVTKP